MSPEQNFQNKLNTNGLSGTEQNSNNNNKESVVIPSAKIHTSTSSLDLHKVEFTRPTNVTGTGATRVRTFHVRLSESAMEFLDDHINEWLDANPDVEIKFINTTIGPFEGKRGTEQNLILNVWY